jgi:membrane protease subunit HflK
MSKSQGQSKKSKTGSGHHHHHHSDGPVADRAELDPASQALAEALRISFIVLKILMVGIIAMFVVSGIYKVEQNEWAVELRFGKVKGVGVNAIDKEAGLKWKWPSPIEDVIKIHDPTAKQSFDINTFWYFQDPREKAGGRAQRFQPNLQFARDGYLLTASQSATRMSLTGGDKMRSAGADESTRATDYSIVHTKWSLDYVILDPIVLIEQLWDGTGAKDKSGGWLKLENFLRDIVSDGIIVISANSDIDGIMKEKRVQYKSDILQEVVKRIQELEVGLKIIDLRLVEVSVPRQVQAEYYAASQADSLKNKLITEAEGKKEEALNAAYAEASIIEAKARGYSTIVIESAKADEEYLKEVLDKINKAAREKVPDGAVDVERKRKEIYDELLAVTVDQLYQEMLREVISNADETFVLSATDGSTVQWRPVLSRDATLKKRSSGEEEKR